MDYNLLRDYSSKQSNSIYVLVASFSTVLQCILCNCYNIDQGVYCKYSIEWWQALCVEKVR